MVVFLFSVIFINVKKLIKKILKEEINHWEWVEGDVIQGNTILFFNPPLKMGEEQTFFNNILKFLESEKIIWWDGDNIEDYDWVVNYEKYFNKSPKMVPFIFIKEQFLFEDAEGVSFVDKTENEEWIKSNIDFLTPVKRITYIGRTRVDDSDWGDYSTYIKAAEFYKQKGWNVIDMRKEIG